MTFTSIQSLLPKAARKYGIAKTLKAIEICVAAGKILEDVFQAREHCGLHAKSFKDGTLQITVSDSAWNQELMMHKKEIIDTINDKFKRKIIKYVRTKIVPPKKTA